MTQAAKMELAKRYRIACSENDRYTGSCFVTKEGKEEHAKAEKDAYDACVEAGIF